MGEIFCLTIITFKMKHIILRAIFQFFWKLINLFVASMNISSS